MLLRQKIRRYAALLLMLFLIFQLIPGAFVDIKCLDSHAQKSSVFFSTAVVQTDITFFTRDTRKPAFQSASPEYYNGFTGHLYFVDVSEISALHHAVPADHRKEIKQTIPHYFHGSKYKENSLII